MIKGRFALAAIVLALCSCRRTVAPPQFPLDHYKFWKVTPNLGGANVQVAVRGQFDSITRLIIVSHAEYIGNPVEKRRPGYREQPIQNEKLHYVAYSIHDLVGELEFGPPPIKVTNQFGTGVQWKLGRRQLLLVPAAKSFGDNPGEPPAGDHFLCYDAHGPQVHAALVLEDQFDKAMHQTEQVQDLVPAYFCVPVRKERALEPPQEIRDPRTHLAIYDITKSMTVSTKDQFLQQKLTIGESKYLGVPSTKEVIKK